MTQPAHRNVKDELDDIRQNGDPRFSAQGKAAIAKLLASDDFGHAIDELTANDFDELDSDA